MTYARVFCFDCKGTFELHADRMQDQNPAACPHCGAVMPTKAYAKLFDVTMQLAEIEKDLRAASDVDGITLFSVDLANYHPRIGRKPKAV